MRAMLNTIKFENPSVRNVLPEGISSNGRLEPYNWVYLINNATWRENATVPKEVAEEWIKKQCKYTRKQLIEVLESIEFESEELPTYLMDGDIYLIDA